MRDIYKKIFIKFLTETMNIKNFPCVRNNKKMCISFNKKKLPLKFLLEGKKWKIWQKTKKRKMAKRLQMEEPFHRVLRPEEETKA